MSPSLTPIFRTTPASSLLMMTCSFARTIPVTFKGWAKADCEERKTKTAAISSGLVLDMDLGIINCSPLPLLNGFDLIKSVLRSVGQFDAVLLKSAGFGKTQLAESNVEIHHRLQLNRSRLVYFIERLEHVVTGDQSGIELAAHALDLIFHVGDGFTRGVHALLRGLRFSNGVSDLNGDLIAHR